MRSRHQQLSTHGNLTNYNGMPPLSTQQVGDQGTMLHEMAEASERHLAFPGCHSYFIPLRCLDFLTMASGLLEGYSGQGYISWA